jgi:hypothetical protein
MAVEVFVGGVSVHVDLICVPDLAQDPHDCTKHEHVPGQRRLVVDVSAVCRSDEDEAAWRELVGQRVPLAAAPNVS